jgi:hypothetical protein
LISTNDGKGDDDDIFNEEQFNKDLTNVTMPSNLDFWPGIMILFSIAFGPTFLALSMQETYNLDAQAINKINIGVLGVIVIFALINLVSTYMLNHVYSQKKLGSFQEMAWSTSNGNRGYIFLISAMKTIYLVATSAYCISFIASYLTALIQWWFLTNSWIPDYNTTTHVSPLNGNVDFTKEELDKLISGYNWKSYLIYASFVIVLSAAAYLSQQHLEPQHIDKS